VTRRKVPCPVAEDECDDPQCSISICRRKEVAGRSEPNPRGAGGGLLRPRLSQLKARERQRQKRALREQEKRREKAAWQVICDKAAELRKPLPERWERKDYIAHVLRSKNPDTVARLKRAMDALDGEG
jgi:hypothetical protein